MIRSGSSVILGCLLAISAFGCSTSNVRFQTANARQRQLNADLASLERNRVPGGGYRVPELPVPQQLPANPDPSRTVPGFPEFQPPAVAQSSFPVPEARSNGPNQYPPLTRQAFEQSRETSDGRVPLYAGERERFNQTMPAGPPGTKIERAAEGPELIGRVVNSVGEAEPGASVQIIETGAYRQVAAETATDRDGAFRVRFLRIGSQYEVVAEKEVGGRRLVGSTIAVVPNANILIQLRVKGGSNLDASNFRDQVDSPRYAQDRPSRNGRAPIPSGASGNGYREPAQDRNRLALNTDFDDRYAPPQRSRENRPELADNGRRPIPIGEGAYRTTAGRTLGTPYATAGRDSDDPILEPLSPTVVQGRDARPANTWMTPVGQANNNTQASPLLANAAFTGVGLNREALSTSNGDLQSLGDLKGDLFLLDFFGSWCGPCRACIPKLNQIHQRYGSRGLHVVGFASEDGSNDQAVSIARKTKKSLGIQYTVLVTPMQMPSAVKQTYQVSKFPTLVLVDRSGRVILSKVGGAQENFVQIQNEIERRLNLR